MVIIEERERGQVFSEDSVRRPVIFLFLAFVFGIALEYHLTLGPFLFFIFSAVLIVFWIFWQRSRRSRIGLICLFLFTTFLGSFWFYIADRQIDPLETNEGTICSAEGRIITVQNKEDWGSRLLITADKAGKRLVYVNGKLDDPKNLVGKRVVIRGTVRIPDERRNPGLFDYRLYLKTKGVRVILECNAEQVEVLKDDSSFLFSNIARLKYGFLDELKKVMVPEAFGLMAGMLFGDCSFISDDIYESFQKNGVAHILSVSGIHVGIVYLYISRLLGNRKTKTFYLITALMLLFYAALSEFSPSVVRSVVMIFIHMFSKVSYRRYDFMTCTCASALGMLAVNPFYLFNVGFQLSYMAVFCLAALLPWADRKLGLMAESGVNELLIAVLRYLSPLLIIQAGMAPITAYLFNYFSVASFFVNMPIIALSGIIIPLGICLVPISFIGGIFFGIGAGAAELLTLMMLWLNQLFYLPGIGVFNIVSPPAYLLLIFYGFFFLLTSEYYRILYQRRMKKAIAVCCILIIALSVPMCLAAGNEYGDADMIFLDVGQGDCLIIRTPEGRSILIDGGGSQNYRVGEKILLPYLLKNGIRSVDLAIVTHLHDDHFLGLKEIAGSMEIRRLGLYDGNRIREREILADTKLQTSDLLYLREGERIRIEPGIWIDTLYPEQHKDEEYIEMLADKEDENSSSLILKVYYRGLTVLMTGDLGFEGELELMDHYGSDPGVLRADILKIGHHGSRYSTSDSFLESVSPRIAVFQVGKNNFGHPHPSVIEKCSKKGIIVYRNDLHGAIIFECDEKLWSEGQLWHTKVLLRKNMHIKE